MEPFSTTTESTTTPTINPELHRLESQHDCIIHAMGGNPLFTPTDLSTPGLRILDSGCANGRWLKDLASLAHPAAHTYVGTDVDESFYPDPIPEGFIFQNQTIVEPWPESWNGTFDLVHQRLVLAACAKFPVSSVVENFAKLLKAGGWLQLVEIDAQPVPGNPESYNQYTEMLNTILLNIGFGDPNPFRNLGKVVENAGLQNVQMKEIMVPLGATAPTEDLKAKGVETPCAAVKPLQAVLKSIPGAWKDEWSDLEARLRRELTEVGAFSRMFVFWGQKA